MSIAAEITLGLATFFCALVAGFLFAFAVVVMPGIRRLADRDFLRAFQVMDRVIQRGQPLFGVVWIGSVVAMVAGLALGLRPAAGPDMTLLALAGAACLAGVQLPTFLVNIPLNNELQALDVNKAEETAVRAFRQRFEARWTRWNAIRTAVAAATAAMLVTVLVRY